MFSRDGQGRPLDSQAYLDVPHDSGLLLTLSVYGICSIKIVKDAHAKELHPNIHVPASLHNSVQKLAGGGSGVTVMSAVDPQFGDVVLKHGSYKDTQELFALATIEQEFRRRGKTVGSPHDALDLVRRTPDFQYIYIHHMHLLDKSRFLEKKTSGDIAPPVKAFSKHSFSLQYVDGIRICNSSYQRERGAEGKERVKLVDDRLEVYLDSKTDLNLFTNMECTASHDGYRYLQQFVSHFASLQELYNWKVTLAQKAVGDESCEIASILLANGALCTGRLTTLINEKIDLIHRLETLTLPEERAVVDSVAAEFSSMTVPDFCPSQVSATTDMYVGRAIMKNFHPETGRFRLLRKIGELFREDEVFNLTQAEERPAHSLGVLLEEGTVLEKVFAHISGPTPLDTYYDTWYDIIEHANSFEGSKASVCIWTGGLTDGGLHNMFLDEKDLWLFDLGDPVLMSLPGFLTKFLFSFFHTLGMQETPCRSAWVNRFVPGKSLHLTEETMSALKGARQSYLQTLDRLISEVFQGEEAVRHLLMKYVILQLLSDCAFCLERWETKGGGTGRAGLEKWLWRALWDFYISADLANEHASATCGPLLGA